jgi:putative aldouronate transport system permease protein
MTEDRLFDGAVYAVLLVVALVILLPCLNVVVSSITPLEEILKRGGFVLFPTNPTLGAYRFIVENGELPRAMLNTVIITVGGTSLNMLMTVLLAYPLSRPPFAGKKLFFGLVLFTMFFSGGLIPMYLLLRMLRMTNTLWAMIFPGAVSVYNTIIMRSFFDVFSEEVIESARMDGAGEFQILLRIVLPLSMPVLMTVGLYFAVAHWNEFFRAVFFVPNARLHPLQPVLRSILLSATELEIAEQVEETRVNTETLKAAAIVFSAIPIVCVYPFIQRYFVKGVMLGAVKG